MYKSLCQTNIFQNLCLCEIKLRPCYSQNESGPRLKSSTGWPNHVQQCPVFKKEFTSAVTIMPRICHEHQPPFCHFVMLTGAALCWVFQNGLFFYAIGCFINVCKNWSKVKVVMFKCNNIEQSTVTTSLTEVQQSQQSQLPKSTRSRFGCLIKVVFIKKIFSEDKYTIRIMVKL